MTDDLLTQIRTLSSGTLAGLSGYSGYDDLDAVREAWLVWALHQPSRKLMWQASWRAFSEETPYVAYAGNVA